MPYSSRSTIDLHPGYCDQHHDTYHMIDDRGNCHGDSMQALRLQGYTYLRHIGSNYYRYLTPSQPAALQLDAHLEEMYENRFELQDTEIDF